MDTTTVIVVVILLVLGAILGFVFFRKQRTKKLREQFGPEYERTVREVGGQDEAEAELEQRQKRIEQLEIHSLSTEEREQFSRRWKAAQARFVDDPARAINEADQLVMEVMEARGYPMGDFEQRAADISVDHPHVVRDYRAARKIALANERSEANTEDLRQAMVHYRSLFEELLDPAHDKHKELT
jgi:uncharacterized protein YneF (UPF0154 family)